MFLCKEAIFLSTHCNTMQQTATHCNTYCKLLFLARASNTLTHSHTQPCKHVRIHKNARARAHICIHICTPIVLSTILHFLVNYSTRPQDIHNERWGAGVETQKYVRGEIGGWGRVPFNESYAPSLSTIYDGA